MLSNPRSVEWLALLHENLRLASEVTSAGREEFLASPALQLAGEALVMRVGDLAKKLLSSEPGLEEDAVWKSAARTRDFVTHHYHRVDRDVLWETVTASFSELRQKANHLQSGV